MRLYKIGELARLSGVSVRTLRYYDKIGLLKPDFRGDSKYRYYTRTELLRLQQILFFKELEMPLKVIKRILDDPDFNESEALKKHQAALLHRRERLDVLLSTLAQTIKVIDQEEIMSDDHNLYKGFNRDEIEAWEKEVEENYDPGLVKQSRSNVQKMSKDDMASIKNEQLEIAKEMATLMGQSADSKEVQHLMARQHAVNEQFYKTSAEVFKALGEMYVSDPRFRNFYDVHKPGLAEFMRESMNVYADLNL